MATSRTGPNPRSEAQGAAVDDIDFAGAGLAVVAGVVLVGHEHVCVEEVRAVGPAAGVAQLQDVLLDGAVDAGFAELGAIAVAEEGVAPVGGGEGKGRGREEGEGEFGHGFSGKEGGS